MGLSVINDTSYDKHDNLLIIFKSCIDGGCHNVVEHAAFRLNLSYLNSFICY
jgi:hypothetical protein